MDSPRVSCLVLAAPFLFNCVVVEGGGIVFLKKNWYVLDVSLFDVCGLHILDLFVIVL